ncbi:Polysaccharide deacetylase [Clostridium sp. DSM 8431]|uniref:polysaccharide deacetylase family protein n=1 Tax=Clostridium sp. DSM 8431 TaxID=1761781 RepID=UPI0008E251A8|nr:polysaccharide deacetylase family protein [Clostridium sp. DSM 8431]SFU65055.1 Polysaccharide deacetylase [Clostridium sp. DSM 8431]
MNSRSQKGKLIIIITLLSILLVSTFAFFKFKNDTKSNNSSETSSKEESVSIDSDTENDYSKDSNRFEGIKLTSEDVGVPVLYYHSVLPDSEVTTPNEVTISPEKLKQELEIVKNLGYTTITLSELNDYLNNKIEIPEKSIVITFDDGYTDNYIHAFPILKELGMKATVFMISSQINSGYYMSAEQLKEMSDYGIDIESHTDTHAYLDTLSYDEQLKEMTESKRKLEEVLGKDVTSIAYPFGNYNKDTVKASEAAGYTLGFTTNKGLDKRTSNKLELDRIYVSSTYSLDTFKERLLNTK